jgi:hypothetical protein
MRRLLWVPALASAAVLAGAVLAQAPGGQAPAANAYAVTADVGPWMICAASFSGPEAPGQAAQLAEYLRTKHRMAAYTFNLADEARRQEDEEYERAKATNPYARHRRTRHTEQCAVLVGGFPDMDAAKAGLPAVRQLPVPEAGVPLPDREFAVDDKGNRLVASPFARSMVVRNPAVRQAPTPKPTYDPDWEKWNSGEKFSLLENPKGWTLVVKEYSGNTVIQSQGDSDSMLSKMIQRLKPAEGLNASAKQAHALAEFLRQPQLGFDAYVLHMRTSSIVTVGGFDGPDDPALLRTQERLAKLSFVADPTAQPAGAKPQGDPIKLFARPIPMQVPRKGK